MYRIEWKNAASKELRKLERTIIQRIVEVVDRLASNPRPEGCRKLQGSAHLFRVRVGDYRIVYSVVDDVLLIEVIRVGHRRDVYRKST